MIQTIKVESCLIETINSPSAQEDSEPEIAKRRSINWYLFSEEKYKIKLIVHFRKPWIVSRLDKYCFSEISN